MSDLYRDFIDQKADQIINSLGGTITPAPANAELYRDFLDRKFDDVITAIGNYRTPVKSFKYTGVGVGGWHRIDIPNDCRVILAIYGFCVVTGTPAYDFSSMTQIIPIMSNGLYESTVVLNVIDATYRSEVPWHIKFGDGYIETRSSSNQIYNLNQTDIEYTVYYI